MAKTELSKDQRYRRKNLDSIREKDRLRAARRRLEATGKAYSRAEATSPSGPHAASHILSTSGCPVNKHGSRQSGRCADGSEERALASPSIPSDKQSGAPEQMQSAIPIVQEVHSMVWEWLATRGPVSGWTAALSAELNDAKASNNVDQVIRDWQAQGEVGEALVRDLRSFVVGRLPDDEASLRDIIRQAFDLLSTLSAGIAVIKTNLDLLDVSS